MLIFIRSQSSPVESLSLPLYSFSAVSLLAVKAQPSGLRSHCNESSCGDASPRHDLSWHPELWEPRGPAYSCCTCCAPYRLSKEIGFLLIDRRCLCLLASASFLLFHACRHFLVMLMVVTFGMLVRPAESHLSSTVDILRDGDGTRRQVLQEDRVEVGPVFAEVARTGRDDVDVDEQGPHCRARGSELPCFVDLRVVRVELRMLDVKVDHRGDCRVAELDVAQLVGGDVEVDVAGQ